MGGLPGGRYRLRDYRVESDSVTPTCSAMLLMTGPCKKLDMLARSVISTHIVEDRKHFFWHLTGQYASPVSRVRGKSMKQLLKRMLTPLFYITANRKTGFKSEIAFWEKWIRTRGSQWPDDFQRRLDPHSVVTGYHCQVLERIDTDNIHILDVGAGPLTTIGKLHHKKTLIIKACDPLADEYKKILDRYSVDPPVVTEKCAGERLGEKYQSNYFDWVNAQNCVDHSADPVRVIREMIQVTKGGGFISLCHEVNEAKLEAYRGLHQWNFYESDGNFMISGKYGYQMNLTEEFKKELELTTWVDENDWIYAIGKKRETQ